MIFFPPAAALILPLLAAIGTWSPLLLLTTLLPSLAVLIPSLIATRTEHKSQARLDKSNAILEQIDQEKISAAAPRTSLTNNTLASSDELKPMPTRRTIFDSPSNESSNEIKNPPMPKPRSLSQGSFFTSASPSIGSSALLIKHDLIDFSKSL